MSKTPYCKYCKREGHFQTFCHQKPKAPIHRNKLGKIRPRDKTTQRDREFKNQWIQDHPPDEYGYWTCYLQISPNCPRRINIDKLQLEHAIPAGRGEKYKYDSDNVKPSEFWCNSLKGSRTLESMIPEYPHLKKYVKST